MRRLTVTQRRIVRLLADHPTKQLSIDSIAAELGADTRNVVRAMRHLRAQQVVLLARPGRGRQPHTYQLQS